MRKFDMICEAVLNEIQQAGGWHAWHNEKWVVDVTCDFDSEDGEEAYAHLKANNADLIKYELDLSKADAPMKVVSLQFDIKNIQKMYELRDIYSKGAKESIAKKYEDVFVQKVNIAQLSEYDEYPEITFKLPMIMGFDKTKVKAQVEDVKEFVNKTGLTWQERFDTIEQTYEIKAKYPYPVEHGVVGKSKADMKKDIMRIIDDISKDIETKFGAENYVEAIEINGKVIDDYMMAEAKRLSDVETKHGVFPKGFFEVKSGEDIETYAKRIAKGAKSRSKDAGQAIKRVNFYKNRAGENLSKKTINGLEKAIKILQGK